MNPTLEQIGPWLNAVGVPGLLAVGLYALHRGWVVTGREHRRACDERDRLRREDLRRCDDRYGELKAERDEWKAAALRHLSVAERAVDTAEVAAKTAEAKAAAGGQTAPRPGHGRGAGKDYRDYDRPPGRGGGGGGG
jgi:hypothetical protein